VIIYNEEEFNRLPAAIPYEDYAAAANVAI
jgi:hypothetical protein